MIVQRSNDKSIIATVRLSTRNANVKRVHVFFVSTPARKTGSSHSFKLNSIRWYFYKRAKKEMRVEINSKTMGIPVTYNSWRLESMEKRLTVRKNRRWKFKSMCGCMFVCGVTFRVTVNVYVTSNQRIHLIRPACLCYVSCITTDSPALLLVIINDRYQFAGLIFCLR